MKKVLFLVLAAATAAVATAADVAIYSRMTPAKGETLAGERLDVDVQLVKDLNLLPRWEGTRFASDVAACKGYQEECDESWARLAAACDAARKGGYEIAVESDELKFARPSGSVF